MIGVYSTKDLETKTHEKLGFTWGLAKLESSFQWGEEGVCWCELGEVVSEIA
jgi:hypothetical protein